MGRLEVSLADAKARLSELTELAAAGEEVVITKRGRPVARFVSAEEPSQPVNLAAMRDLTAGMSGDIADSDALMRQVRDGSRY
jgi:prevent-host-death family protein